MRISDWSSDVCSSDPNATGGVINLITAKPNLDSFEGSIKGEVGNYNSRRMSAILNIPIVKEAFGLRIAGALTDREGYDYNSVTENRINGRDLYSLRDRKSTRLNSSH